jgi:hypothetical protein
MALALMFVVIEVVERKKREVGTRWLCTVERRALKRIQDEH